MGEGGEGRGEGGRGERKEGREEDALVCGVHVNNMATGCMCSSHCECRTVLGLK